ncbi:hypothetical protein PCANC_12299 [Puccinia coronata f. sp. avenae]|uniref:Uncharacterized protein n=1 Tax=Puccinia coronata f. sp. avenae TaxID=200324 RepID=A0A2N5UHQ9_9BASI|nr:hypothetical protein PCANC_12299 [Puccinia coronata f. sp. avenae]PLW37281.1 hypothetical protein PCASD_09421 [Puccinia coronata f. sp. avenae]
MRLSNLAVILSMLLQASLVFSLPLPQGSVTIGGGAIDISTHIQLLATTASSGDVVGVYNLIDSLYTYDMRVFDASGSTAITTADTYVASIRQLFVEINYHYLDLNLVQARCADALSLIQQTGYSYYVTKTSTTTTTTTAATGLGV